MRKIISTDPDRAADADHTAAAAQISEAEEDAEVLDAAATGDIERRPFLVTEDWHRERLDKVLVAVVPEFSRSYLQRLIAEGCVCVDGKPVTSASRRVSLGQAWTVDLRPTPESQAFTPEAMALDVVFEDEHLLVLNKPAGLVVHPAPGNWSGTLLNGLLAHHRQAAALPRAGIVHRLDKDTSGLMVVGKTLATVTALVKAIAARSVQREYLALVHGEVRQASAVSVIEAPIGRDPQSRVRMAVVASGKPARTDVEVLALRSECSWVKCRLHSGRTHQIRVHLAHKGFPLVGDTLYGGACAFGLQRQALHAARLGLAHPARGDPLVFSVPCPDDLLSALTLAFGAAAAKLGRLE